jgi:hypothetical protein
MSRRIVERLTAQENIARHDSTQISKPNLHSRTNTPLIMPTQKIRQSHQHNRLRDVSAQYNQEQRKVLDASRQVVLCEEHNVAN